MLTNQSIADPAQKDPLTPYLVNVKQTDLEPGKYNVILGEQLASQLGVNRGDQIRVMVPSASQPLTRSSHRVEKSLPFLVATPYSCGLNSASM